MKKFRKIMTACALTLMCGAALTGCGDGGNSTPATTTAAKTTTAAPASTAADTTKGADTTAAPATTAADSTAAQTTAGGGASGDLIKVGIINNNPNESGYRTANDKDLTSAFTKENGFDAKFAYGEKNDEQINQAKKFIQDEVDYLLLSAADTAGWDSVLKDAQAADIKVILFDRKIAADESLYESSVVSDMEQEGKTAVEWLKSQNLDKYEIIHIQGQMGTAAQEGRSKALNETAKELGWTLVAQQTGEWNAEKAQQIVQSAIDSKKTFNVIYAENDDMAKGAAAALDKANISHGVGKDVIIMGFDCNKWALKELKAGNWNYDGQCNPFQSSYLIDIIKKLEKGEKVEKKIIMQEKGFDAKTITDDDVNKYGIGE